MRWTIVACVAIVAFDAITAVGANALDFAYGGFPGLIGSTAIYAFPAVMAVRDGYPLRLAVVAGAMVALVDATIGWAVSWVIGPGAPPPDSRDAGTIVFAGVTVVVLGAGIGLVAGLIARAMRTPSARP